MSYKDRNVITKDNDFTNNSTNMDMSNNIFYRNYPKKSR